MSLDTDTASQAIIAYFGPGVFHHEPTWCSVLLEEATTAFDSPGDLCTALDLMNLGVEIGSPAAPEDASDGRGSI